MNKNSVKKGQKTKSVRAAFVATFSQDTLQALRSIVNGRDGLNDTQRRSFAAYKANLTRGTYRKFIRTNKKGVVVSDKLGLV